jgi:hypothetical protein
MAPEEKCGCQPVNKYAGIVVLMISRPGVHPRKMIITRVNETRRQVTFSPSNLSWIIFYPIQVLLIGFFSSLCAALFSVRTWNRINTWTLFKDHVCTTAGYDVLTTRARGCSQPVSGILHKVLATIHGDILRGTITVSSTIRNMRSPREVQ